MRFLIRSALALAPAVMLGAYASYPMFAFLPWIALVPWVVLYTDDSTGRVPWSYYFVGAFAAWLLEHPEGWQFGWFAPVVFGLVCIVWWFPFAPVLSRLHGSLGVPRPLAVGIAWTAVEWLRSTFTVSHFDLYGLGYSQARFPLLVQFADVTGVYGVSFVLAAANGCVADWILTARESGWRAALSTPRLRWSVAAIVATIVAACGYGAWRMESVRHEPGPKLAIVQPNLRHSADSTISVHLAQLLQTEQAVSPGEVDLIVWPENAILDDIRRDGVYLDDLGELARRKRAWFVVGALGSRRDRPGRFTNGAWLVDSEGSIRGEYQKRILFPWSEYLPADEFLGRWFPGLQRIQRRITRFGWGVHPSGIAGDRGEILEFPWRGRISRFATLICVENVYPPYPASAARREADFFLNITSEGLVGGPVQEQLLRIAMLRAIENRMSYVRVGNTGISGIVDAVGRATAILRGDNGNTIDTPGVLVAEVPIARASRTLYCRSHDLFARTIVATAFLLILVSWVRGFRLVPGDAGTLSGVPSRGRRARPRH